MAGAPARGCQNATREMTGTPVANRRRESSRCESHSSHDQYDHANAAQIESSRGARRVGARLDCGRGDRWITGDGPQWAIDRGRIRGRTLVYGRTSYLSLARGRPAHRNRGHARGSYHIRWFRCCSRPPGPLVRHPTPSPSESAASGRIYFRRSRFGSRRAVADDARSTQCLPLHATRLTPRSQRTRKARQQ